MGDTDADGAAVKCTGRAGQGEQRAPGRCRGSGLLSSGLDSPGKEQRAPEQMQKERQSSGLDGPGKEEQRGPGLFTGAGQVSRASEGGCSSQTLIAVDFVPVKRAH